MISKTKTKTRNMMKKGDTFSELPALGSAE